jgi:catalase
MRFFDNNTKRPDAYYEPNSFGGPKENKRYAEPELPLHGSANRYDHRDGNDDYTQAGNLFRLFSAEHRLRLFDNIAAAMQGVPNEIKRRQIALFAKCDPAYGAGVANAVKLEAKR